MVVDIRTLMLISGIMNLVNVTVLTILWLQYRKHYRGLHFLLFDMLLHTIGFFLSIARDVLPSFISIVFSNFLLLLGALLVFIGLEIFFDKMSKQTHNYIGLAIFAAALVYFTLMDPSLTGRNVCISLMIIFINTQTGWLLIHRISANHKRISMFTAITLLSYVVVSFVRIIALMLSTDRPSQFFQSGLIDTLAIISFMVLSVLTTVSFVVLVSRRLLDEIQLETSKYSTTFNTSPSAILLTRMSDGKIIEVNESFHRIMGFQSESVIGKTTIELNLWEQENDRVIVINELASGRHIIEREFKFRCQDGSLIFGLLSSRLIEVNNEKCIITHVSDVTEMIKMRQNLHELATHDSLTGLPNRLLFYDRFEIAKANAEREKKKIAIVSMDIDFLKKVNDEYGHHAGDIVLATVSNRMQTQLRKVDSVARFGGDEFALMIWSVSNMNDIIKVIENLQKSISAPITIEGVKKINISVSAGVAMYPEDGSDIKDLLKQADESMYDAKRTGRDTIRFSNSSLK